jgi:hypothetical protein
MKGGSVIFSRNSGSGGRHAAEEPRRSPERSTSGRARARGAAGSARSGGRRDDDHFADDRHDDLYDEGPEGHAADSVSPSVDADFGPYDVADAPEGEYLDLGSLKIPTIAGVEVRVQANNEGVVQQVALGTADSVLQLAVFAAPRSEGIWDEVRGNIRKSLLGEGVAVEEIAGDYGRELRAQVRADAGMTDIRFVGVDGPRWMVRAIYQGLAAREPSAAGPLADCLRGLVVDRGKEAMPAEEALPLRLPREMADAAKAQMAAQQQAQAAAAAQAASPQAPADAPDGSRQPGAEPTMRIDASGHEGNGDAVYGGHASSRLTNGHAGGLGVNPPGGRHDAGGRASANSTGDHPTAGHAKRGRPSPRPRRPE